MEDSVHFVVTWWENVGGVYPTIDAAVEDRERWDLPISFDYESPSGPHTSIEITQWRRHTRLAIHDYQGNLRL